MLTMIASNHKRDWVWSGRSKGWKQDKMHPGMIICTAHSDQEN